MAPALKVATGGLHSAIDYQSFVGVGAVGLVIPLSCIFAGLSVLVDRDSGAQRELLAAPVPRAYLVIGNLIVAVGLATLQVAVLIDVALPPSCASNPPMRAPPNPISETRQPVCPNAL